MSTTAPALLLPSEAAARLRVTVATLSKWRSRGYGPAFVRVGDLPRYREVDVVAWIESRIATSTAARFANPAA